MTYATAKLMRASDSAATTQPAARKSGGAARFRARCESCNLREVCLPCGLPTGEAQRLGEIVYTRKRVKRGDALYRAGEAFGPATR